MANTPEKDAMRAKMRVTTGIVFVVFAAAIIILALCGKNDLLIPAIIVGGLAVLFIPAAVASIGSRGDLRLSENERRK